MRTPEGLSGVPGAPNARTCGGEVGGDRVLGAARCFSAPSSLLDIRVGGSSGEGNATLAQTPDFKQKSGDAGQPNKAGCAGESPGFGTPSEAGAFRHTSAECAAGR